MTRLVNKYNSMRTTAAKINHFYSTAIRLANTLNPQAITMIRKLLSSTPNSVSNTILTNGSIKFHKKCYHLYIIKKVVSYVSYGKQDYNIINY